MRWLEKRARAQAARGVSAIPKETPRPCAARRVSISPAIFSSPPNRCATPTMSSMSPSASSSATSGVNLEHQSASFASSRASSSGAASIAIRLGRRARASASDRPALRPRLDAKGSTQTSLCAPLILAMVASGAAFSSLRAAWPRPVSALSRARARSVDRRANQRERNRRVTKAPFNAIPFKADNARLIEPMRRRPLSGRAQPGFQQPRRKGGQTRQVQPPARRLKRSAGSRRDLETRFGGAGNGAGPPKSAAMKKRARRAARPCRKQQTARSGEAIMARRIPHFADHDRQRAALERLFHRPQQGWRIGRASEDEPARAESMRGKPRPIKSARLARAKILADETRRLRARRDRDEP